MASPGAAEGTPTEADNDAVMLSTAFFRANGIPACVPEGALQAQVDGLHGAMIYTLAQVRTFPFDRLQRLVNPGIAVILEQYCEQGLHATTTRPPFISTRFHEPILQRPGYRPSQSPPGPRTASPNPTWQDHGRQRLVPPRANTQRRH